MLIDERGHLQWVKQWLDGQPEARRAAASALLFRYTGIDATIRDAVLHDYRWREAA